MIVICLHTIFVHWCLEALLQSTRSALVAVSFVDRTSPFLFSLCLACVNTISVYAPLEKSWTPWNKYAGLFSCIVKMHDKQHSAKVYITYGIVPFQARLILRLPRCRRTMRAIFRISRKREWLIWPLLEKWWEQKIPSVKCWTLFPKGNQILSTSLSSTPPGAGFFASHANSFAVIFKCSGLSCT